MEKDKKKVEIPEQMLQEIDGEVITDILRQVAETEESLGINQSYTKKALESLRGQQKADLTNTIIAFSQILDAEHLMSIHKTLGLMLRVKMLNELKDMVEKKKETSIEE